MIRVGIVDDHPVVREGLRMLLRVVPDIDVTLECEDGPGAIEALNHVLCDVLLLDLKLKGNLDGLATFDAIQQQWPALRVIILTSYRDPDSLAYVEARGAHGYLDKTVEPDDLLTAIRQVARGRRIWDRNPTTAVLPSLAEPLTAREQEVLMLLAQGLSNKEIGVRLGIREKTVKVHLSHLFAKLAVYDRTQAVIVAYRRGLVRLTTF